MAEFKYEGDIINISSKQMQYISEVLKERGFNNSTVLFEAVGKESDNFIANVKRIIATTEEKRTFEMIAKFAPSQESMRLGNTTQLFQNEILIYTEVLPKLSELEEAVKIPSNERLRYARCYGALNKAPNEMILLEDLKVSGFTMLDKSKPLSDEHIRMVLKDFAKLHSLSHVLKNKDVKKFQEIKNKLYDVWGNLDAESVKFYEYVKEKALSILTDEKQKQLLNIITFHDVLINSADIVEKYKDSKYTVILQGDPWTNNIMFRINAGTILELAMIDYQVSRVNIPSADIMYLIFNCTDHPTRQLHFQNWLDYYQSELTKYLEYHGLDAEEIYPKNQLKSDIKSYAKTAFGLSMFIVYIMTLSPEEAVKAKEFIAKNDNVKIATPDTFCNIENIGGFKEKLEGLLKSFIEFDLL